MRKKKFICLLLSLIFLVGCSTDEDSYIINKSIEVIVSENFGSNTIDKRTIEIRNDQTVMEVMLDHFEIETAYGGGFINAIGDIKSGFTDNKEKKKYDWFYYINGLSAEVGADDYLLNEGDQVIWDYHSWENGSGLKSIIGAYPGNLKSITTEILYSDEFVEESKMLSKTLGHCNTVLLNEESLKDTQKNSIVIASHHDLEAIEYIKNIYENEKKIGLSYEIDNKISTLDYNRNVIKEYEKGAIIASIEKSYGEKGILWLVTGNDKKSIAKAVNILAENPEKIRGAFSVLVTHDEIIRLPIEVKDEV